MAEAKIAKRNLDMTSGNPYKLLLQFAIPLFVGNLFQQLYNTVDSIVVGRFVGTQALAAVGTAFPFMTALMSLYIGIGVATTVMIAQRFGAKDFEGASRVTTTVYRVLYSIIPLALFGYLSARPLLTLLNVPDDGTLDMAVTYIQIIMVGSIGTIGYNINTGIMQGLGDSVTPVRLLILSTFINIVLDLIFVIPMGMGVGGAALATVIAQMFSWLLGVRHINKQYDYIRIKPTKLPFYPSVLKEAMRMGLPMALQNVLFSVGIMVLYSLVNSYGSDFMAGFTGANKIDTFVFLPLQSIANALTAFTGQNVGARKLERVKKGLHSGLILTLSISSLTALILVPFSSYAMKLFNTEPAVVEAGVAYLHRVLPSFPLLAVLFVFNAALRGVGRAFVPMLSSLFGLWVARVPAAYWLASNFGRDSLYYSYAIGWIIGCAISIVYFYFGDWHSKLANDFVVEQEEEKALV